MPKYRLAVQFDVEIEVDPDSGQDISPQGIRQMVWKIMAGMIKNSRPEEWKIPGVRSRFSTQFFAPSTKGVAEVVEVTSEMDVDRRLRPRWKLVRVGPDDDTADHSPWGKENTEVPR